MKPQPQISLPLPVAKHMLNVMVDSGLGGLDQWTNTLAQLDAQSITELAPLLGEAVKLPNEYMAGVAVKRMLDVRPEWRDAPHGDNRDTPLITAVRMARLDLVDMLIEAGAKPTSRNKEQYNALDVASGDQTINHRIQEALADAVMEGGRFNRSAKSFALALAANSLNLGAVRSLLKHGADFSVSINSILGAQNRYEIGHALAAACNQNEDNGPVVKVVAALLASPLAGDILDQGWDNDEVGAAIHAAAYNGSEMVLGQLIETGARVNPPEHMAGELPKTPLMSAAFGLNPEAINILIRAGADPTLVDADGRNALHHLADTDSELGDDFEKPYFEKAFRALVEAGCDPFLADDAGITPLDLALQTERTTLIQLIGAEREMRDLENHTPAVRGPGKKPRL